MTEKPAARGRAGSLLVEAILADMASSGLTPDARETELLERARLAADRIEDLEAVIAEKGLTYSDRWGHEHASPMLGEVRAQTSLIRQLLSSIQLAAPAVSKNPVKQRAGQASWAARLARQDRGMFG